MKTKIPVYDQSAEAVGGIYIDKIVADDADDHTDELGIHRHDFFIFFLLTKGKAVMKCDMADIEIHAYSAVIIKPFQIHSVQSVTENAAGYFISVAPFLIPNDCADVFQNLKIAGQSTKIEPAQKKEFLDTISLLHRSFMSAHLHKTQIINGLFNALVYRFANVYQLLKNPAAEPKNQARLITANFKKLILENSFLESPAFFAKKLHISTSYLNDCVNASTGNSVTWWLQNRMIIEAQRLLYYTENDVKEIAFTVGFEDHTYFSRLFKKITHQTPLGFRKKFRE